MYEAETLSDSSMSFSGIKCPKLKSVDSIEEMAGTDNIPAEFEKDKRLL